MCTYLQNNTLRVAVVGSGPAGFYAADHLFKKLGDKVKIDMFDRLPTPYGLVRSGVAPDHQKIKSVTRVFDKIASNENFRFFGYVELGKDITIEELSQYYNQVVICTGAQTDRKMKIPGEDLISSHPATEFVAWYNGHPDYRDFEFDLSAESVAIVGVGNVAIDVARILCLSKNELLKTDITDYAMDALLNSNIKKVYLLGRRGAAQAAFTNPELRELGKLEECDIEIIKSEIEIDPVSKGFIEESEDKSIIKKMEILNSYTENVEMTKQKKIALRFLVSPTELIGDEEGKVSAIKLVRNKLVLEGGRIRPVPKDEFETLDVGLVFRSIGYHGVPLPDVPFNESWGVISNEKGRISDPSTGNHITGLYTSGWIKRGPSGVIGTNKTDSSETVDCMIEDLENGFILHPKLHEIDNILLKRKPDYFSYADWNKINSHELSEGEITGRPRIKVYEIDKMLELVKE